MHPAFKEVMARDAVPAEVAVDIAPGLPYFAKPGKPEARSTSTSTRHPWVPPALRA